MPTKTPNPESSPKDLIGVAKRVGRAEVLRLLDWYQSHKRHLPWRTTQDPYSVWVSEIMLQQTTVNAVIPFYLRWMEVFPTVQQLAGSKEQEILLLWEGLGYYNRARHLHQSAKLIVERHNGSIPSDYRSLTALPGIGDYTAGAILSISYGKPYPVVDANIRRIGQRLHAWPSWGNEKAKLLENLLKGLIPLDSPGSFNEAFMELGQTVCLRSQPLCDRCPLSSSCLAFAENRQHTIPARNRSAAIPKASRRVLLLRHGNGGGPLEIWIFKKTEGLLKGLWLFPPYPDHDAARHGTHARGSVVQQFNKIGDLPSRIHSYTRYREKLQPVVCLLSEASSSPDIGTPACSKKEVSRNGRWVELRDIHRYPMPAVYRKIVADLQEMLGS
jgi:A/G-specific adenine glycosylase